VTGARNAGAPRGALVLAAVIACSAAVPLGAQELVTARIALRTVAAVDSVRRLGKGGDRPLNPLADRMAVLAGLAAVDLVVPFDTDTPRDLIAACLPDVLVKGGDYTAAMTAGASEVIAAGGKFVAIPFLSAHSTSALIEKIRG
jgi:rfaE bifunctional protein nucleotidyltransferase chain/domain